jgi:hypothetical protein
MCRFLFSSTIALSFLSATAQQQLPPPSPSQFKLPAPEIVKLSNRAQGLVEPIMLPLHFQSSPKTECDGHKESGEVTFSLVVDGMGRPRNIVFKRPLGKDMDSIAIQVAESDRFRAAALNGAPAAVAGILEVHLHSCTEPTTDVSGIKTAIIRLSSIPDQRFGISPTAPDEANLAPFSGTASAQEVATRGYSNILPQIGGDIIPPTPLFSPAAENEAGTPREQTHESCGFSMTVDEHGMPQDIIPFKSVGPPALLNRAFQTVRMWRFTPAMKDGMPIPAHINVALNMGFL